MTNDKNVKLHNMKSARAFSGYSQEEIAKKLNITPGTYNRYENHVRDITFKTAKEFSEIVNIPMELIDFSKK